MTKNYYAMLYSNNLNMLEVKVSLFPTVQKDLDTILAIEISSENSQYIGYWNISQHKDAIANSIN